VRADVQRRTERGDPALPPPPHDGGPALLSAQAPDITRIDRCPFWTGITPPSTKAGILRRACRCLSDSSHISTRERIRKRPTPHSSPTATRYFSIGLPLSTGCSAVCNLLPRDRRTTIRTLAINRFPAASISSMTTSTRGACPPGWSHCPRDPRQGRAPVDVAGRLPVGRTGD
jgi:hypothetical protein